MIMSTSVSTISSSLYVTKIIAYFKHYLYTTAAITRRLHFEAIFQNNNFTCSSVWASMHISHWEENIQ
jgi:hypothetical protein